MKKVLLIGENSYIGKSLMHYSPDDICFKSISVRTDNWKDMNFSEFDCIIHLAAIVHTNKRIDEKKIFQVNTELAIKIAKKAKEDEVPNFILFSTIAVYGDVNLSTDFITKDTKLNPKSLYGKSKMQAEIAINKLSSKSFKVAVIRPPMVYGKSSPGNFYLLEKIALHWGIFPKISNSRSMIYIENLCYLIYIIISSGLDGTYFPQNKEYVETNSLIRLIRKEHKKNSYFIFGRFSRFIFSLFPLSVIRKVYGNLMIDQSLSNFELDYNPISFQSSIKATQKK